MMLILACGNTIRGDDQAGWRVADIIEKAGLPGVVVQRVHQLTPELAEVIAEATLTVVVDAGENRRTSLRRVKARARVALTHYMTAETLTGLVETLYGGIPTVHLLSIPGSSFGLSEDMSVEAMRRVQQASRRLLTFLDKRGPSQGTFPDRNRIFIE